jgi:hypothetical protein
MAVDEVTLLADSVRSYVTGGRKVLTPSDGDTAELSVGHAAYSVRLIDTPYLSKEEVAAKEEDAEPPIPEEPFEAQLGECTVSLFDCIATGKKVALDGSIVLAPRAVSKTNLVPPRNVFVCNGEVLLTDLRAELIAEGMKADYKARLGYAQLVVNGKIVVKKKLDSGKIDVEGLCVKISTRFARLSAVNLSLYSFIENNNCVVGNYFYSKKSSVSFFGHGTVHERNIKAVKTTVSNVQAIRIST